MKTIGILGFGKIGKFIYEKASKDPEISIVFIWNRTISSLTGLVPAELILEDIHDIKLRHVDLIIEVCHPEIIKTYGEFILQYADLMIGSPTAMADRKVRNSLQKSTKEGHNRIFIPSGAMWGIEDIRKVDAANKIKNLKITMEKHPNSIKIQHPEYQKKVEKSLEVNKQVVIYEGPVTEICKIAPNNVNTMSAAALACENFGFDNVIGCLLANPMNIQSHVVTIELENTDGLTVKTTRTNPAGIGNVTGTATFDSFWYSVQKALSNRNSRENDDNYVGIGNIVEFC